MNYDNGGQIRAGGNPMPQRLPNEYPMNSGGPRPIPSGYPAHALPGNAVRFYPPQQPQQQPMAYPQQQPRGYFPQQQQQQFYPGDNSVPRPPRQQHFFQQQNSQQFYPNQQGNQQMFYQQQQQGGYQYPQQYPSQGIRQQQQQQQQQGFHQQHPGAMIDNGGGSHFYGQEYQQQPPQQFQRFPGYQQQQQQPGYTMQHSTNQRQVVPQHPPQQNAAAATNFRPPIRTGFRNPGGPRTSFFPRPPRPQMVRHPQQIMPQPPPQQYQQQYPASTQQQALPQWPQQQPQATITTSTTSTIQVPVTTTSSSQNVIHTTNAMTTSTATTTTTTTAISSTQSSLQASSTPPQVQKVSVPWGWMRTMVSENIIYRSPSGIELKSPEEIREYLLKEGTCKCGLECPLELSEVFDFDANKSAELTTPMPTLTPNPSKYCKHKEAIVNLAKIMSTPGLANQFKHVHDPWGGKKGKKRSSRKKRPYSGLLTPQMVEAREAEKRRINEIINQQKQAYEAEMSLSIGGKKTGALIMTSTTPAMTSKAEQSPVPEIDLSSVGSESTPSSECIPPEDEVTVVTDDDDDDDDEEENENEDNNETNATNAKNIEIRRMSATDEGDKVLEGVWDSPEKEKGSEAKTPLQMVQSIVSKIEEAKMTTSTVTTTTTTSAPPAWTTMQGGQRPLLHSQKHMANDTPPTSRVITSIVPPPPQQKRPPMSQSMTVMAPQLVQPSGQQFMQLVNTINGPMLMQAIPQAPPQIQIHDPSKGSNKKKASPGGTPQVTYQQPQANIGGPMPILVSPTPMMTSQTSPTGQHVLISHPSPGSGVIQGAPQFVLNQPAVLAPNQVFLSANGTLVAMPAAPTAPVVYNQLPDGTLVQMQSPTLMPAQQQFVINNGGQQVSPGGGQIITNTGGTYIMTPTGLVQTVPAAQPPAASSAPSNQTTLEPQPGPSSSSMERKDSTEKSEDSDDDDDQDDSDDEPKIVKFVQTDEDDDEDDDEDTSDEEVPLAKKKSPTSLSLKDTKSGNKSAKVKTSSPKTYLQSNKVDSSGLQATPPHPHDDSESSMKRLSSPEASVSTSMRDDALDTSGSTDGGSGGPSSSTKSSKRKRKRNADELIKDNLVQSDDEDSDDEVQFSSKSKRQFNVGELVWGPHGTFPSWPGKLVRFERDDSKVLVCWFGNRDTSQVNADHLKSLSDGLEAHHRERKKLRKGRKMNASLEKAIQEAMMELDRMTDD